MFLGTNPTDKTDDFRLAPDPGRTVRGHPLKRSENWRPAVHSQ
jgi:hypothetical protein